MRANGAVSPLFTFYQVQKMDSGDTAPSSKAIVAGITIMVDETKTIVEAALPLAKEQRQWSKTRNRWRRDKNISEDTIPVGRETKILAKR
jgi:hypothetical protein